MTEERKRGRVTKVVVVDKERQPIMAASAQEVEDPFNYGGAVGLVAPPYNPAQLVALAERHPTHAGALEQKVSDIAGTGWIWEKLTDDAPDEQRDQLEEWFKSLADPVGDETVGDVIRAAWDDVETIGHGAIEVARDGEGKVQYLYSVAGQSLRFHKSGKTIAQGITGKRTWFKRWIPGDDATVDRRNGKVLPAEKTKKGNVVAANELLILRRPSRRSRLYGVPAYVAAVGWLSLSLAARDDNIQFFNNRREPRWAIVLQNIEEDDDLEKVLQQAFSTDLAQPHKNIIIPIEGDGKVTFQKMSEDTKDVSFERLQERASAEILLAHRLPPDRLGMVRVGPLGGNATMAASRIYKEGVVITSQNILAGRFNRFIETEGPIPKEELKWKWKPIDLDITEEPEDVQVTSQAFQSNLLRLDEARKKLNLPPVGGEEGQKFFYQLAPEAAQAGAAAQQGATQGAIFGQLPFFRSADGEQAMQARLNARILEILGPDADS